MLSRKLDGLRKFKLDDKVVINPQKHICPELEELMPQSFWENTENNIGTIVCLNVDNGIESYTVAFEQGHLQLDESYLVYYKLTKMKMDFDDIGELVVAFKLGKQLEYYDETWKLARADSLDEILYNIIECGTFYRVKNDKWFV